MRSMTHDEAESSDAGAMSAFRTLDPQEGARLIRAFVQITDASVRHQIVGMVERVARQNASPGQAPGYAS